MNGQTNDLAAGRGRSPRSTSSPMPRVVDLPIGSSPCSRPGQRLTKTSISSGWTRRGGRTSAAPVTSTGSRGPNGPEVSGHRVQILMISRSRRCHSIRRPQHPIRRNRTRRHGIGLPVRARSPEDAGRNRIERIGCVASPPCWSPRERWWPRPRGGRSRDRRLAHLRACYGLWAARMSKRCSIRQAKARK